MIADKRRTDACLKACEGVSTQSLEDNVPFLELARRYNVVLRERAALRAELDALKAWKAEVEKQEQKPVAWERHGRFSFAQNGGRPLYALPGAQPAQRLNMQTADQVTQAFKAELQALLDKYGAELSARDTWEGYPECGEDVRMQVAVPAIYDADHNCLREYTEIDLGSWVPTSLPPSKTPARSRQGLSGWRKR